MAPLQEIEIQIRQLCESRRVRVENFFMDFDKLRSGFVTCNQFLRTLWMNLGVKLSEEQESALLQKYRAPDGRFNYRRFCDSIDAGRAFRPDDLSVHPSAQIPAASELLGTRRSVRPLSPDSENKVLSLLEHLARHYRLGGYSLRAAFKEFDRHNVGCVTESQFYRALPVPKEFGEAEVALLSRRYADPERAGLVSYLNLQSDLDAVAGFSAQQDQQVATKSAPAPPSAFSNGETEAVTDPSIEMILQRLRVAVHKYGIRLLEFLRDHDKLRHDLVTENQFVKSLMLAIGKQAQLTLPECHALAHYFAAKDGSNRVRYRDFALAMDSPFNVPHLEKKPLATVEVPAQGSLARTLPRLTAAEEADLADTMEDIRRQVLERRLMVYQYFKDYDRSTAYTRVMTPQQFARSLHFLTLDVSPEKLKLLARKFADPATGDVNYPAFAEAVDADFCQQRVSRQADLETRAAQAETRDWQAIVERPVVTVGDNVTFDELMVRIRSLVLSTRARVKDFFVDYDTLRSGLMTRSQFQRCLSQLGLSKLGWHDLSSRQLDLLCNQYADARDGEKVRWMDFVADVDSVFTRTGLEKDPFAAVPAQELFVAPKPGTINWEASASPEHRSCYDQALERLALKVAQRRMLVRPTFRDFDKHRRGTMSRTQFRQAMTMLGLHCEPEELEAIEARFAVDEGFNYAAFLEDLEPEKPVEFMYGKRLQELRLVQSRGRLPDLRPATDADQVLYRIRTKAVRERIRVQEFLRDFDKLRSGRISKVTFRRALSGSGLQLGESEFSHLEDLYQSRKDPDSVEWMRFVDDVEAAFTQKHLDKTPLANPEQFVPEPESCINYLPAEAEQSVNKLLLLIAQQVRERRTQMLPFFESYDKVHHGTISQNQFRRVLTDLGIVSSFSEEEWALLYRKFKQTVGTREDVNYFFFVDVVYSMAGFDTRKP
ncbi:hypothetical protein BOX15_Mlig010687g4 [Macrostomum lignano]|uniref:EF-hand domain-containing protein n=1 Tax=Macrostomum lignano TaxID=282301 RepID=A0A267FV21_9PLAT|nr:hypothetical protein BOX15_Mlig010687g4 [Macrostomum lignano]